MLVRLKAEFEQKPAGCVLDLNDVVAQTLIDRGLAVAHKRVAKKVNEPSGKKTTAAKAGGRK